MGNGLVLDFGGIGADPLERSLGGIHLTSVSLDSRIEQAALFGEGRAAVAVLEVGEDATRALGVTGLGGSGELIEHRSSLHGLIPLPPVPAIPGGKTRQRHYQHADDEVAVLAPEALD